MDRADVGLMDRHVVRRAARQSPCQLRVALDGDDERSTPREQERERAGPGTEIEDEVAGFDARSIDEPTSDVRPQEVL